MKLSDGPDELLLLGKLSRSFEVGFGKGRGARSLGNLWPQFFENCIKFWALSNQFNVVKKLVMELLNRKSGCV